MAILPTSPPRHGGDLAFAARHYGNPYGTWLDLSTGVSPRPYPAPAPNLVRLPDTAPLLAAARAAYRVPEGAAVVATPGSELAIRLLPIVAPPGEVAIVGPTYASHEESWRAQGRDVVAVPGLEAVPDRTAVVVIGNPNNPDGRLAPIVALQQTLGGLASRGGLLIVDEAFADLEPDASFVPHIAEAPVIVLRSLGKFYGLPGLRLGFALGAPEPLARLAALLGDWPVSTHAVATGIAALSGNAWRESTRQHLSALALRLRELLARHRLAVVGGTDLFVLVDDPQAGELHIALARQGIWTRAFAERPRWLRLGLPGDDAAFTRLDRALAASR